MKRVRVHPVSYAWVFGKAALLVAGAAALLAPTLDSAPRNTVWICGASIAAYVAFERLAARLWIGRAISFLRATLLIATSQPLFLILALFAEGDATYRNRGGNFSHTDDAWLVALVGVVLLAAALLGAVMVGRARDAATMKLTELRAGYSQIFLILMCWMAASHGVTKLLLVFAGGEIPVAVAYAMRLYLSLFQAVFFYLGMALRSRSFTAQVVTAITLLVSMVVLLTGGRSDALFPLLYLGLGFVLAWPIAKGALIRGTVIAFPVFLLAMYVGGLVRSDELGRTGEAAISRAGRIDELMSGSDDGPTFAGSTLRRMVSNSTHSVITRIPGELPFEPDGLTKLPGEFADRLLPRFNLTGYSDTENPRNWMLNDLGFLVTWSTRVELAMVADAWYRGGWSGVLLVGLMLGAFMQLMENGIYLTMRRLPQFSALLVFMCTGLIQVGARDIVGAVRAMVFLALAGMAVVSLAMILEARRARAVSSGSRVGIGSALLSAKRLSSR